MKPFSFLLSASVAWIDRPPPGAQRFHLIAPYSRNPSDWRDFAWIDVHSGEQYRTRTEGRPGPGPIRVQTYNDVLDRFRNHPESKSAGPDGMPSGCWTVGLLSRLDLHAVTVSLIGKEANLLEQQEEGVVLGDPQAVYAGGNEWERLRAQLQSVSLRELSQLSGVSPRMLRDLRQGTRKPSARTAAAIVAGLGRMPD